MTRDPVPAARRRLRLAAAALLFAAACSPDGGISGPSAPDGAAARGGRPPPPPPPPPAGVCNYDVADETITGAGWTRVFADEFGSADLSRWSVWYGGAWNEELQLYQPGNLSVSGGVLAVEARRETVTGPTNPYDPTPRPFDYTSGRIESVQHFSASAATPRVRLAARLRLAPGYGMWPAFWSYGDPWPTQGEIDIVEARGHEPFQYQTAYWWGRKAGVNQTRNTSTVIAVAQDASLTACWHVFEVVWSQDRLEFLLDGAVVDVKTGGNIPNMFGKQQRITVNLAVGGLFFSNLDPSSIETGTLYVDWVRAYTAGP